jgi:hypothetical protein
MELCKGLQVGVKLPDMVVVAIVAALVAACQACVLPGSWILGAADHMGITVSQKSATAFMARCDVGSCGFTTSDITVANQSLSRPRGESLPNHVILFDIGLILAAWLFS